jgi:hypothetical protein
METPLATGIILAGISALAFVAYFHSDAFSKQVAPLTTGVTLLSFCVMFTWNIAIDVACSALTRFIPHQNADEAQAVQDAMSIPDWPFLLIIFILFYVSVLSALPSLLNSDGGSGSQSRQTYH